MKNFFAVIYILASLLFTIDTKAQHQEISEKPGVWKEKSDEKIDSTSILNAFKKGDFSGQAKNAQKRLLLINIKTNKQ